jgi:hypothetical protein
VDLAADFAGNFSWHAIREGALRPGNWDAKNHNQYGKKRSRGVQIDLLDSPVVYDRRREHAPKSLLDGPFERCAYRGCISRTIDISILGRLFLTR